MKYLIFAALFVSTFLHAEGCFSYMKKSHKIHTPYYLGKIEIGERCKAGMVLDFRIWNLAESEFNIDDSLIALQTKFCNYDTQITHHKNSTFSGFTCIMK